MSEIDPGVAAGRFGGADLASLLATAQGHVRAGRADTAEAIVVEAAQKWPQAAELQDFLGILYARTNRLGEAIEGFARAVRLAPGNASYLLHLGHALAAAQRYDEAFEAYRDAVATDPASTEAHINLGNLLLQQRRPEQAAQCFRDAIAADPRLAVAHVNLGITLQQMGMID
jgi:tetratricopeptide (TPR) repeat protein